jgi:acyl carrier protein
MPIEIRTELRAVLSRLGSGASFTDADDVFAQGVVTSFNMLELITFVEERFGLEVNQRDIFEGNLRSVDAIVALVVAQRDRGNP